jgi:hypothetical protein
MPGDKILPALLICAARVYSRPTRKGAGDKLAQSTTGARFQTESDIRLKCIPNESLKWTTYLNRDSKIGVKDNCSGRPWPEIDPQVTLFASPWSLY